MWKDGACLSLDEGPFKVLKHAFMVHSLMMQSLAGVAPWVWHSSVWVKHLAPAEPTIHHHLSILLFFLSPQENMQPLAISCNVKVAPSGCHIWAKQVVKCGWVEVSVTARSFALLALLHCCWLVPCYSGFGSVSGVAQHRLLCFISRHLEKLGGRYFLLSISRTYCQPAWWHLVKWKTRR